VYDDQDSPVALLTIVAGRTSTSSPQAICRAFAKTPSWAASSLSPALGERSSTTPTMTRSSHRMLLGPKPARETETTSPVGRTTLVQLQRPCCAAPFTGST
jgi:hypothetical protein